MVGLGLAIGLAQGAPQETLPVLGQPAPAVGQELGGRRQLQQAGVVVRQMQTRRGVELRAYVDRNGNVFGLAWQGVSAPDLSQLLGARFAAYRQALARQSPRRRGPVAIAVPGMVVQLSGHMRDLRGRAWLTDAVPATLSPAVIQ
ncbi:MAG TPA: DUF2844 domain-containing protein [Terriglobales bacterium]|nr:DUF2844 domain-containing protein [Terriglobales bacterium]